MNRRFGSLFLKFFMPYMLIIALFMGVASVAYYVAFNEIENNAVRMQEAYMEQSKAVLDGRFKEIRDLSVQIKSLPLIEAFASKEKDSINSNMFLTVQLKNQIGDFKIVNDTVIDFAVYYGNSGTVLNRSSLNKFELYYPSSFELGGMNAFEFRNLLFGDYYTTDTLSAMEVKSVDYNSQVLPVLTSIGFDRTNPDAVIMLLIDTGKLKSYMATVDELSGGNFYIINEQSEVVMSLYEDVDGLNPLVLDDVHENSELMTFTAFSDVNDWQYVLIQSSEEVFKEIEQLRKGVFWLFGILLLIGVGVSWIAARMNSKPVQILLNDNEALNERMQMQRPFMRQTFLENWLSGKYKNVDELRSIARVLKADYEAANYCVFVIDYDEHVDILGEVDESIMNELEMKRIVIKDLLTRDLIDEAFIHDVDHDKLAVICISDLEVEAFVYDVREKVTACQRLLIDHDIYDVMFGVGNVYDSMEGVTNAMLEAVEATHNALSDVGSKVVWYSELEVQNESYYYPPEVETRLFNATRSGDVDQTQMVIRDLLSRNIMERNLSANMMKLFIYEIWGTLAKISERCSRSNREVSDYINDSFAKVENLSDVEKIYHSKMVFVEVCKMLSVEKQDKYKMTMERINTFMEEHYCDADFGLMMISEEFSLSEAYISQIFKEFNGDNFINHLQNLRMKKAEDLLLNTNIPIKRIVTEVGYNSSNTFGKAFKRRHGISASEFRAKGDGFTKIS